MKKRIYLSMMLLAAISLLAVTVILGAVFYRQLSSSVRNEARERANLLKETVGADEYTLLKIPDMRLTIIAPNGTVLYDDDQDAATLPNHADREEVREALATGVGESNRFSATLGQETYYYAVKLADGSVLRVAKTTGSIFGLFSSAFPAVAGIVILTGVICYLAAGRLTKRIIAPLTGADPQGELSLPYDELAPFIKTIAEQRESIARQLADLQNRSDIIDAIMDNINEGIILTNKQGNILSANKSVMHIFEKDGSPDGKNILEFWRDVDFSAFVRSALNGKPGEMGMKRAGKTYRVFFSHVRGGGAIILFLDVTERSLAEKLRREFSANVSHELKTPLTSIYGNAEMLHSGMIKETDQQKFYEEIKNEAGRLIALIEDILMLSRLDEGSAPETRAQVDLKASAAEVMEALAQKATEYQVTMQLCGESALIKASPTLIYEMFYNLIDNAIKYNKPGGTVDIRLAHAGNQLTVSVADTGIGIPLNEQERVFERFYRVDKSRSKKTGGTGLGLAIVKHIVLVHEGRIMLKSRENEGTAITIAF